MFHWVLATSLIASWITAEAGFDWAETHFFLGYTALALVLFRIIWGFAGTRHSRFGSFVRNPLRAIAELPKLISSAPTPSVGHNPLGGWSTLLLLTLVAVQAGTGLFISDDIFYAGPYNPVVSGATAGMLAEIHHINFTLLQIAVALHVTTIMWYAVRKRQNLVAPMLTGRKTLEDAQASEAIEQSAWLRGLIIAAVAAAAVTLLIYLAPPPSIDDYY